MSRDDMHSAVASKRRRLNDHSKSEQQDGRQSDSLVKLLEKGRWEEARQRALESPGEVDTASDPSPLALACRGGAPFDCIRTILEASPPQLRHVLDSRGTPLHEAIVCDSTPPQVIELMLKTDEALGSDTTRATLLQDVDGFTPLHLLIRRRFQSHILSSDEDTSLMQILEMLVRSCPHAVVIPDRGEYEEPPIVYALKANIYAPALGSEDATLVRVERQIFEMVACMLRHFPMAASRVFSGFRGQYTALHSAVFHGRYTNAIDLILRVEAENRSAQKNALLANTQGELPLHFCAMRGERPQSVALIAKAAPEAILKRDASGLTPFHWLWIRFLSTLLALDNGGRAADMTIEIDRNLQTPYKISPYCEFTSLEKGNFSADLQLIKRMDPSVDFLRMRHIPVEVLSEEERQPWVQRSIDILNRIRERYYDPSSSESETIVWSRQEVVISLFWTKVVSLLETVVLDDHPMGDSVLVHTAFATPSCPPPVAQLVASLLPEQMTVRDASGRLPIHFAAGRAWHAWDWPRGESLYEPTAAKLLQHESLAALRTALEMTPQEVLKIPDGRNRLVLHHVIDSFVHGCSRAALSNQDSPMEDMLEFLKDMIKLHPEALAQRDGASNLYPFLQASATATEKRGYSTLDELPLTITYLLLREDPVVLSRLRT